MIPANTPPPLRILAEHSRRLGGKIRGGNFAVRFDGGGMTLDLSNQSIDDSALRALLNFARARQLKDEIAAMMSGEKVNFTERLPALHPALRGTMMTQISPKLRGQIADERGRFLNFAHRLREGEIVGARGNRFCDVVNIGMGGSESGARLIATALENSNSPVRAHFVGDADGGGIKKHSRNCIRKRPFLSSHQNLSQQKKRLPTPTPRADGLKANSAMRQVKSISPACRPSRIKCANGESSPRINFAFGGG